MDQNQLDDGTQKKKFQDLAENLSIKDLKKYFTKIPMFLQKLGITIAALMILYMKFVFIIILLSKKDH